MQNRGNKSIKNLSADDRPREKMLLKGTAALSNAELLAIILGSGSKKLNAVELAQLILSENENNLALLSKKSIKELQKFPGVGPAKAITVKAAMALCKRKQLEQEIKSPIINDSHIAYQILSPHIDDLSHEEFWVLFLNQQNKLIAKQQFSTGGITGTVVDIRLVLKEALMQHAIKIVLAHNHPSGNKNPSNADIELTKKFIEAGKLMDILILDHLIITQNGYSSVMDHL